MNFRSHLCFYHSTSQNISCLKIVLPPNSQYYQKQKQKKTTAEVFRLLLNVGKL